MSDFRVLAMFDSPCEICHFMIARNSPILIRGNAYYHPTCWAAEHE